jgi:hypothetical protein
MDGNLLRNNGLRRGDRRVLPRISRVWSGGPRAFGSEGLFFGEIFARGLTRVDTPEEDVAQDRRFLAWVPRVVRAPVLAGPATPGTGQ